MNKVESLGPIPFLNLGPTSCFRVNPLSLRTVLEEVGAEIFPNEMGQSQPRASSAD